MNKPETEISTKIPYTVGILPDRLELDYSREWDEQELIDLSESAAAVLETGDEIKLIPLTISFLKKDPMTRGIQYSLPLSD